MALIADTAPSTLEDVLGQTADTAGMTIQNQYAKARRKAVGEQAASGRLGSGVANYTMGDINAGELTDLASNESDLATALGQIPTQDYMGDLENARRLELAKLIGKMSKKGGSAGIASGVLSGGASGAMAGAPFGLPGIVIGGVLGAGLGGYAGSQG